MDFIIVTGVSGSGKSSAADVLEDIGYFCIDNMPPQLIPKFAELCGDNTDINKVAIVVDIRGGELFLQFWENVEEMRRIGLNVKILFIYANKDVIRRRYKETRRKHPLYDISGGDIDKAINEEFNIIMPIKEKADYCIDSSFTTTAKFKESMLKLFLSKVSDGMIISCMSFGYKYGIPDEADLVFDVRFMPNPFYVPELKFKTGEDKEVRDYVMNSERSVEFRDKLFDMLDFLVPQYISEGKSQLVIAFGCTGGRHRSVTFAELTNTFLSEKGYNVHTMHRDSQKQ
ncbi:MAG: RNase adapter RapZ [Ruminiclostridium sp.]|nr:RNase adapter RapZ [Ruminiclostridium sp.]